MKWWWTAVCKTVLGWAHCWWSEWCNTHVGSEDRSQWTVGMKYYAKRKQQCFIGISKHREESLKYDMQWIIFDEIWGVG